jgi:hypothetical protein
MSTEALVERYIRLRDAKEKLTADTKSKTAKLDELMNKIEAQLLVDFNATGAESVKTACGTAYKTTKTFAGVGDWPAFIKHVTATGEVDLLTRAVNKTAVSEYMSEHNDNLPPGVTWREEIAINVRRS